MSDSDTQQHDQEMQKLMRMLKSGVSAAEPRAGHEQKKSLAGDSVGASAAGTESEMGKGGARSAYVVVAFFVGLAVGFGAGRLSQRDYAVSESGVQGAQEEDASDEGASSEDGDRLPEDNDGSKSSIVSDSNFVEVKDQEAGAAVFITRVGLTEEGWVAIHEDRGGDLGNILGAKRFEAGVYQGEVQLLRRTGSGMTYYAVLYGDDGDRVFDFKKDPVLAGLGEEPILFEFETF